MSFMRKQVQRNVWWEIDGDEGTTLIPADLVEFSEYNSNEYYSSKKLKSLFGAYYPGSTILEVNKVRGWAFRLSAPGYTDCTDWTGVFSTAEEAVDACDSMYENDDESDGEEIIISNLT